MFRVLHLILGEDEDVIQVRQAGDVQAVMEYPVDVPLECCQGVDKPERHHAVLKMAIAHPEGHLPLVALLDPDQVVCQPDVELGVHLHTNQPVKRLVDQGQRVAVLLGEVVEPSIVNAQLQGAVLFLHKEDGHLRG